MKIAVAGTGYVGLVTGVCLASKGHKVTCVDVDENKVKNAKKTIINGLIGVAIVMLAYFAVNLVKEFILDRFALLLNTIV